MLRVTIDLWPFGEEQYKKTLGTIDIVNDGSGNHTVGYYNVTLSDGRTGKVSGWPRLTSDAFDLVLEALGEAVSSSESCDFCAELAEMDAYYKANPDALEGAYDYVPEDE